MAIIQISKLQQRSGNLVDLPQLDDAEFGWATDYKQLYIGKGLPAENIEVLTSYSNISFSQIDGSGGNIFATTALDGQILGFDGTQWVNKGGVAGGTIDLGSVNDLKIAGGSIGYVLETDGLGTLSWTSKGVLVSNITDVTQANPGVVTTLGDHNLPDKSSVTITDVLGMVELNSNVYYAKVLSGDTFALYSDSGCTVPVNTTGYTTYISNGRTVSSVGGSGVGTAGGSNNTFQFNDSGILNGSANFSLNAGDRSSATLVGTLTAGNLSTAGTVGATGNITGGNIITGGIVHAIGNVSGANLLGSHANGTSNINMPAASGNINLSVNGNANIIVVTGTGSNVSGYLTVTGNITGGNANLGNAATANFFIGSGNNLSNIQGANVSGTVPTAGTVTTAAQPNITSVGTLVSLTVTATATAGNLSTGGTLSVTGNANVGNLGANIGLFTGNVTAPTFIGSGAGTPTVASLTNLDLSSPVAVRVIGGGTLRFPNLTSAAISGLIAANGDTAYNTTLNKFQMYEAGAWSNVGDLNTTVLSTGANTTAGVITGNWTLSLGSKLQSTYADLAEYYEADFQYEPGTVLEFGGDKEVTLAQDGTMRVAGVVSTNPSYVMNSGCPGIAIAVALQGRAPTKVRGNIRKGDIMVSAGNGFARPWNTPQIGTVIGKALENFSGEGIIEVAVGRL